MAVLSVEARNKSLRDDYGSDKGPNAPTSLRVHLYAGNPADDDSVEVTGGGYDFATVPNDDTYWSNAPADGAMNPDGVDFVFTDTPDVIATHWVFEDDDNAGEFWDTGQLAEQILIPDGGGTVSVVCTVNYPDPLAAP